MKLVFATHNKNKLAEINKILQGKIEILSLSDIKCHQDIPETGKNLTENSLLKAKFVKENFHFDCFADDTGLEIEALNNAPGVYSARYAGEPKNDQENIKLVLKNLEGIENRKAQFRTIFTLCLGEEVFTFEGIVKGKISTEIKGENGFGYDPIFIAENHDKTFAEMTSEEKNSISHRAIATQKLVNFFKNDDKF